MVKEKSIIPSVWGGIKILNISKEASIFLIVYSINFWVDFAFFRRAESKRGCILLLVVTVTFFYISRFITFAEPPLSFSSVKEPYC